MPCTNLYSPYRGAPFVIPKPIFVWTVKGVTLFQGRWQRPLDKIIVAHTLKGRCVSGDLHKKKYIKKEGK